jgi:hypothetical protein
MWQHRLSEILFFFCRLLVSYGAIIAFLAAPPVILLNQHIADVIQPVFPDLFVEQKLSAVTRYEGTVEAIQIVLTGKVGSGVFSDLEVSHLIDVHRLFIIGTFLIGCAIIVSILIEKDVLHLLIDRANLVAIRLISVLSVVSVLTFPFTFELFHRLFFPQGNYAFLPDSLLIQCFPPVFWLLNFLWLQLGVIALLWWQAHHAEESQI